MEPGRPGPEGRLRQALILFLAVAALAVYFPLNRHAPGTIDLATAVDRWLPVVPWLAAAYLGFLVFLPILLIVGLVTRGDVEQVALALLIAFVVSDVIFAIYPTYAPRPSGVSGFGASWLRYVYRHDNPYNDFPSEHAASAVLLMYYGSTFRRLPRVVLSIGAITVIVSTVLLKQHTVTGAAGGMALAVISWRVAGFITGRLRTRREGHAAGGRPRLPGL